MKFKCIIVGVFLVFLFPSFSFAIQTSVSKITLENGLTVLIQEMPSSEIVSLYAGIKVGSATEGDYLGMGISHFVEHMLFKGTIKRPVGAIAKEVKNLGGNINASTSLDYTIYTLDLPKESFNQGLDILSDMLMNSTFDLHEVEKERKVIHGEMKLYKDRPGRVLSEMVFSNVYNQHPYKHPIIGYPMLFDSISHKDLYSYYKKYYVPNNIVLSIAGDIKKDEILPLIQAAFKDFKPTAYFQRNLKEEPPQNLKRFTQQYYATNLIHFSLAYQGVSVSSRDLYALDVLSMALGQGGSSRLYKEAYINHRLVEDISSSNFTPYDKGVFEIEGNMSKDNLDKLLDLIQKLVVDIQRQGLTKTELEKTKKQVLAAFIFSNQTSSSLAEKAAIDEILTADANFSRHYVELIKKVNNEDIKRVANQYLRESSLSVSVLKPKNMEGPAAVSKALDPNKGIKKIVLDNGVTILLHEDRQVLVGSVQLFMNGGVRQEEDSLGGLAYLTGEVWAKASSRFPEKKLSEVLEQKGIRMSAGAGMNTMRISMDFLSEDLGFALDLLEDIVKNPTMPQEIIDRERHSMLMAIQNRQDDIIALSSRALIETLYLKHPLRKDSLGSPESLNKITQSDVLQFAKSLVVGNNMVISVFGNCDSEKVLENLKKKFGSLKKTEIKVKTFTEDPVEQTRTKDLQMDKEQALVMMAFQAPFLKEKDRFGMEIINAILGAPLSGRFFVRIREELGQAYTASSWYVPDLDNGTFILYVLTKPDKIDSVKRVIVQELEDLRNKDVSAQELEGAKSYIKGGFRRSLLTNGAMAYTTAKDELYGLGYGFYQQYYAQIDAVSLADVRRIASEYLDMLKAAIVVTTPKI